MLHAYLCLFVHSFKCEQPKSTEDGGERTGANAIPLISLLRKRRRRRRRKSFDTHQKFNSSSRRRRNRRARVTHFLPSLTASFTVYIISSSSSSSSSWSQFLRLPSPIHRQLNAPAAQRPLQYIRPSVRLFSFFLKKENN